MEDAQEWRAPWSLCCCWSPGGQSVIQEQRAFHDLSAATGHPGTNLPPILKDEAVKVLHSLCQQIWKTQQWSKDWKMSVFIPIPKKGNTKECSNYSTIAFISHGSKTMLKILQGRIQHYLKQEIPDVQAGFRKVRGSRDQIVNICWIIEKQRNYPQNCICFIDYAKGFDYESQQTVKLRA